MNIFPGSNTHTTPSLVHTGVRPLCALGYLSPLFPVQESDSTVPSVQDLCRCRHIWRPAQPCSILIVASWTSIAPLRLHISLGSRFGLQVKIFNDHLAYTWMCDAKDMGFSIWLIGKDTVLKSSWIPCSFFLDPVLIKELHRLHGSPSGTH